MTLEKMTLEQFETPPVRDLPHSQEVRLNRLSLCGDISGGPFSTVKALIKRKMIKEEGGRFVLMEKGQHYCFHHGRQMPVK